MKYSLALVAIILFFSCSNSTESSSAPEPLRMLDEGGLNIPVYDESGLDYFLNQEDDQVHIVNFWATWCPPCVKELPYFEQINEEYGDKGVEVLLVSMDFENQLENKLVPFVQKKLKSDVLVLLPDEQEKMINMVDRNWQGELPATVIYNKNKRYFISGETNYDQLKQKIEEFK